MVIIVHTPKELGNALNQIVQEELLKTKNEVNKNSLRAINSFVRSLRVRLAKAKYSSHSDKSGPWSRNGGTPSEQSIRIKRSKNSVSVYINSKGNVKGAMKPSQYIWLDEFVTKGKKRYGAYKHLVGAYATLIKNLNKLI